MAALGTDNRLVTWYMGLGLRGKKVEGLRAQHSNIETGSGLNE